MFNIKVKSLCLTLLVSVIVSNFALAEISVEEAEPENQTVKEGDKTSLSTVDTKLDQVLQNSNANKRAYLDQPLGERTQGLEFNFFRLLAWNGFDQTLSGTYSRFNVSDNTEFAFPWMISRGKLESLSFDDSSSGSLKTITVDAHYRKFLGHRLDGFYLSAFSRLAYLNGPRDTSFNTDVITTDEGSEFKIGAGVGIGYRIFSSNGIYWGTSLSVGRYIFGDSNVFVDSESISADIDDSELIFDIELLKFGYAF